MCDHRTYMHSAEIMATKSNDPSTKVGAIMVTVEGNCGRGWNCFPVGVEETQERMSDREEKYPRIIHAEMNAIASAVHEDFFTIGGTMYTTHFPCSDCCGILIQFGVKRIVTFEPDEDYLSRWKKSIEISLSMLNEAEIELIYIPR